MLTTTKVKLHTLLGDYPNVKLFKSGQIKSDIVDLDFDDVKVPSTAFKPLVREGKYDLGELAITTYLLAKTFSKPYVLIPATVMARGQLHTLAYNPERGTITPKDLHGKRVGVRAYSVTTGVWVRGMLQELYDVDFKRINWVTFEDAHVAEYKDPAWVQRAPAGKEISKMLLDGELDAAILGDKFPDPKLKTVVPDAEAANKKWAETHGGMPTNHLMVIRDQISKTRPDVVREVFRMLREARAADTASQGPLDPYRFGVEPNRRAFEQIIAFAHNQQLIPKKFTVDELFDDTTRALGK